MNQKQLQKDLGITKEAIDYIREENIIAWSKVGRQIEFDIESVKTFRRSFNIKDYLTIDECAKKLKKHGFYSYPQSSGKKTAKGRNNPKMYATDRFGPFFYITVQILIDGSDQTQEDGSKFLPDEYRLEIKKFGKTQYIPRKSFANTLQWLWRLSHSIKKPEVQWVNVKKERSPKQFGKIRNLKSLKTMKRIKTVKNSCSVVAESIMKEEKELKDRLMMILKNRKK
ncbi:MAG: hypothetical protein HQM01_14375 [Magnetococcales bacterium]|nr:hypothetical protein [Magnetococcales bacterium]